MRESWIARTERLGTLFLVLLLLVIVALGNSNQEPDRGIIASQRKLIESIEELIGTADVPQNDFRAGLLVFWSSGVTDNILRT